LKAFTGFRLVEQESQLKVVCVDCEVSTEENCVEHLNELVDAEQLSHSRRVVPLGSGVGFGVEPYQLSFLVDILKRVASVALVASVRP